MLGYSNTYQKQLRQGGLSRVPVLCVFPSAEKYLFEYQGEYSRYKEWLGLAIEQGSFILHVYSPSPDYVPFFAHITLVFGRPGQQRAVYLRRWVNGVCRTVYLQSGLDIPPGRLLSETITLLSGVIDLSGSYTVYGNGLGVSHVS